LGYVAANDVSARLYVKKYCWPVSAAFPTMCLLVGGKSNVEEGNGAVAKVSILFVLLGQCLG
jgi:hypothetical protein